VARKAQLPPAISFLLLAAQRIRSRTLARRSQSCLSGLFRAVTNPISGRYTKWRQMAVSIQSGWPKSMSSSQPSSSPPRAQLHRFVARDRAIPFFSDRGSELRTSSTALYPRQPGIYLCALRRPRQLELKGTNSSANFGALGRQGLLPIQRSTNRLPICGYLRSGDWRAACRLSRMLAARAADVYRRNSSRTKGRGKHDGR
jgi:hypothetical protein